jgi:GWxTD domain-containing protein
MEIIGLFSRMMACIRLRIFEGTVSRLKLILVLVAVVTPGLLPLPLSAQTPNSDLAVYTSASVFDNPAFDSLVLVQFPFSLNRDQLDFFKPDTGASTLEGRVFAQVTVYGTDGMPVDSATTYFSVRAQTAEEAARPGYRIFNRLSLLLAPGVYSAHLTVIDAVSKREGRFFVDQVIVEPSNRERIEIGGEGLAYYIKYVGDTVAEDRNILNGFKIIPNPIGVFSTADSAMYVYAEIYNLDYVEGDTSKFRVDYCFLDNTGSIYRDFGHVLRHKSGSTAVITPRFDIAGWPVGEYRLRMIAGDPATQAADTSRLVVRIVPELGERSAGTISAHFDPYDTLTLEQKVNLVHYLLTPDQEAVLSTLTPEGKENFLAQFWKDHDSDPSTRIIESRLAIIERYNFANRFFSSDEKKTNGWRTDRGRIYMTYGPWDERVDMSAPEIGNPYVVWYYRSVREGAVFVFEDKQGFHDYTLVHSNMEGEIFNQEWKDRLETDIYRFQ